jgi:hypothetical protein
MFSVMCLLHPWMPCKQEPVAAALPEFRLQKTDEKVGTVLVE